MDRVSFQLNFGHGLKLAIELFWHAERRVSLQPFELVEHEILRHNTLDIIFQFIQVWWSVLGF